MHGISITQLINPFPKAFHIFFHIVLHYTGTIRTISYSLNVHNILTIHSWEVE